MLGTRKHQATVERDSGHDLTTLFLSFFEALAAEK